MQDIARVEIAELKAAHLQQINDLKDVHAEEIKRFTAEKDAEIKQRDDEIKRLTAEKHALELLLLHQEIETMRKCNYT